MSSVTSLFGAVVGPKYDGKYLRSLTDGLLGNLTVKQTLTDVIIPTFDIKRAAVVHEYADLFLAMVSHATLWEKKITNKNSFSKVYHEREKIDQ